jgi:hypothetical protein
MTGNNSSWIALCFVFLFFPSCLYGESVLAEVETALQQKEYAQARMLLIQGTRNTNLPPEERAELLLKLAWFYKELAGSSEKAFPYYREIQSLPLKPGSAILTRVEEQIHRLEQEKRIYIKEDNLISFVRMETLDREEAAFRIDQLKTLVREVPEYPGISYAYYYLGIHYMVLEQYNHAYEAFQKAFSLAPAMDFLLPIHNRLKISRDRYLTSLADILASWTLVVITVIAISLFLATKPWQWIRIKHLIILLVTIPVWAVIVLAVNWAVSGSLSHGQSTTGVIFEQPAFLDNTPGSPGWKPLLQFFLFMLPGLGIVFFFSAAATRFPLPFTMRCVSGLVAFLLLTALSTLFYLDVCKDQGIFQPAPGDYFSLSGGKIYFSQPDIEPYVLTNPRLYPGLVLDNLDEHYYRDWLRDQYKKINQTEEVP